MLIRFATSWHQSLGQGIRAVNGCAWRSAPCAPTGKGSADRCGGLKQTSASAMSLADALGRAELNPSGQSNAGGCSESSARSYAAGPGSRDGTLQVSGAGNAGKSLTTQSSIRPVTAGWQYFRCPGGGIVHTISLAPKFRPSGRRSHRRVRQCLAASHRDCPEFPGTLPRLLPERTPVAWAGGLLEQGGTQEGLVAQQRPAGLRGLPAHGNGLEASDRTVGIFLVFSGPGYSEYVTLAVVDILTLLSEFPALSGVSQRFRRRAFRLRTFYSPPPEVLVWPAFALSWLSSAPDLSLDQWRSLVFPLRDSCFPSFFTPLRLFLPGSGQP